MSTKPPQTSPSTARLFEAVATVASKSGVFGPVEVRKAGSQAILACAAKNSAEPAEYRLFEEGGRLWVSLVTDNRWLSQSIESQLYHSGDKLEELLDEELYDVGYEGQTLPFEHFRSKDLLILEDEFNACSDELRIMTDDGSYGTKGVVTAALDELVAAGNQYDLVITIGPLIMMKFVVKTCQKHGLKSIVSMNPIMIDGTGMCGGCRLTVGGETKFACVDGPDFDGDLVDFDEAMARGTMYRPFEAKAREKACNLFKTEEAK